MEGINSQKPLVGIQLDHNFDQVLRPAGGVGKGVDLPMAVTKLNDPRLECSVIG